MTRKISRLIRATIEHETSSRVHRCAVVLVVADAAAQDRLQSSDLLKLRSVSAVQLSPDGARVAYTCGQQRRDGTSIRPGLGDDPCRWQGGSLRRRQGVVGRSAWSPDGQWIAYRGRAAGKAGLVVARPDGAGRASSRNVRARTRRCPAAARRSPGHPTANGSPSSRRCPARKRLKRTAIRW